VDLTAGLGDCFESPVIGSNLRTEGQSSELTFFIWTGQQTGRLGKQTGGAGKTPGPSAEKGGLGRNSTMVENRAGGGLMGMIPHIYGTKEKYPGAKFRPKSLKSLPRAPLGDSRGGPGNVTEWQGHAPRRRLKAMGKGPPP